MKRSFVRTVLRVIGIGLLCYILVTFVALRVSISRKEREVKALEAEVEKQQIKNEEIQKALDENDREELIRRFAEEQGYAYQGEKLFINEAAN